MIGRRVSVWPVTCLVTIHRWRANPLSPVYSDPAVSAPAPASACWTWSPSRGLHCRSAMPSTHATRWGRRSPSCRAGRVGRRGVLGGERPRWSMTSPASLLGPGCRPILSMHPRPLRCIILRLGPSGHLERIIPTERPVSQDRDSQPTSKDVPSSQNKSSGEDWWAEATHPLARRRMSKEARDTLAWHLRLLRRENLEKARLEAIEKATAQTDGDDEASRSSTR